MLSSPKGQAFPSPLVFLSMCLASLSLVACGGGGGTATTPPADPGGEMANSPPVVAMANLDQQAWVGEAFSHDASQGGATFSDPEGDALTYSIALNPGQSGLAASGATISGTPTDALNVTATITATDPAGGSASDTFTIFIGERADVTARSGLAGLRFFIGQPINFSAADWAGQFEDPSGNGISCTISLDAPIPGLTADGDTLTGSPTEAGTFSATITASNGEGEDAVLPIRIAILRSTTTGAPVLPAQAFDYVGYAEADTPLHFRQPAQGGNSIAAADNTPVDNPLTNEGATLGRVLFYDTRLSVNNTIACASCHVQGFGFGEPSQFSRGFDGQFTDRNAPQLTNVRFYHRGNMFWDERAASLEEQALGPIQSPVEMGNTLANLVATVEAQSFYPPLFEDAFGDDTVSAERIGRALAQFQRAMVSYQSDFDTAVIGNNPNANTPDFAGLLTPQQLHGMALFQPVDDAILAEAGLDPIQSMGCNQCHQGRAQILSVAPDGDVGPQNIGLDPSIAGEGATGIDDFKVPSLRNAGLTAPYMHDGRFLTLEEVVEFYATGVEENGETSRFLRQGNNENAPIVRRNLSDEDVAALVAFLKALDDEVVLEAEMFSDPFAE